MTQLETDSQTDAETQGNVVVSGAEIVPELEAVVVACVGRVAVGVTCSYPEVCKKSLIQILIAECAQERSHRCMFTRS